MNYKYFVFSLSDIKKIIRVSLLFRRILKCYDLYLLLKLKMKGIYKRGERDVRTCGEVY